MRGLLKIYVRMWQLLSVESMLISVSRIRLQTYAAEVLYSLELPLHELD